ncbi:polyprenyl diphosphate synthase [Streptomyces hiroshimensis]|uniref:polyprenyl diphosphate synthase n=1 Tax=Streptomyces hiroshimensis TaxID=66424 RepID=UPI001674226A|nr:polyprenyl diphosphate synthase [Streptomyces hiroshimensis]
MTGTSTSSVGAVPTRARLTPQHVGIIMDGNRRWARARGLEAVEGHREGALRLGEVCEWGDEAGLETLTLWVLSIDNLQRSERELAGLLPLIGETIENLAARRRWAVNPIGDLEVLPGHLRASMERAHDIGRGAPGMTVNIAVGYDGRREIAHAVRQILCAGIALPDDDGDPANIWQVLIAEHLYTRHQADPDLIIRTSGEHRLSGFLLWQTACSEFHFCDVPWPAFTRADFRTALDSYAARHRRYGR